MHCQELIFIFLTKSNGSAVLTASKKLSGTTWSSSFFACYIMGNISRSTLITSSFLEITAAVFLPKNNVTTLPPIFSMVSLICLYDFCKPTIAKSISNNGLLSFTLGEKHSNFQWKECHILSSSVILTTNWMEWFLLHESVRSFSLSRRSACPGSVLVFWQ